MGLPVSVASGDWSTKDACRAHLQFGDSRSPPAGTLQSRPKAEPLFQEPTSDAWQGDGQRQLGGPYKGTWEPLDLLWQGPGLPSWRGGHVPLEGFLVSCRCGLARDCRPSFEEPRGRAGCGWNRSCPSPAGGVGWSQCPGQGLLRASRCHWRQVPLQRVSQINQQLIPGR